MRLDRSLAPCVLDGDLQFDWVAHRDDGRRDDAHAPSHHAQVGAANHSQGACRAVVRAEAVAPDALGIHAHVEHASGRPLEGRQWQHDLDLVVRCDGTDGATRHERAARLWGAQVGVNVDRVRDLVTSISHPHTQRDRLADLGWPR